MLDRRGFLGSVLGAAAAVPFAGEVFTWLQQAPPALPDRSLYDKN
jgi:hypothetical protein